MLHVVLKREDERMRKTAMVRGCEGGRNDRWSLRFAPFVKSQKKNTIYGAYIMTALQQEALHKSVITYMYLHIEANHQNDKHALKPAPRRQRQRQRVK